MRPTITGKSWHRDYVEAALPIWYVYLSPTDAGKALVVRAGFTLLDGIAFMQRLRTALPAGVELRIERIH